MRTLVNLVAGAVGGFLGTVLLSTLVKNQHRLPEPLRGPAMSEDPGEHMARNLERRVGGVPAGSHARVARGLHFAYGMLGPTLLGAVAHRAALDRSLASIVAAGAGLGLLVWAAGYLGWLPAAGVTAPIGRQGASHVASAVASHVGYGVASALPLFAAKRIIAKA